MLPTRPKCSPTEITSPGLIDLSASRMIPLTRLDTIFCRPKPRPTPTAPENSASTDKSMPMELSTTTMAMVSSAMRISLPISTWIDGVRSEKVCTRFSRKLLIALAPHNAVDETIVDDAGEHIDHHPGGSETDADAQQISAWLHNLGAQRRPHHQ